MQKIFKILGVVVLFALIGTAVYLFVDGEKNDDAVSGNPSEFGDYTDARNGFSLAYPKNATERQTNDPKYVLSKNLTLTESGTNLHEKYFTVFVEKATSTCAAESFEAVTKSETVTSNAIKFLKQETAGAGAGNFYETVNYSTVQYGKCYRLQFVLHSVNPANYDKPPKEFNKTLESKVFEEIFKSFKIKPPPAAGGGSSGLKTFKSDPWGLEFQYPVKYEVLVGGNTTVITLNYKDSAKSTDFVDHINLSVLDPLGTESFKDYAAKKPIINENSGQPIPFSQFKAVTFGDKTFYYIVGERFEGYFSTQYYYFRPSHVYLFESHSYIGADWMDPNFNEQNETVHKDLRTILASLKFTK